MTEEERIRLRHMLEAAEAAVSDCEDRGRGDLDGDPTLARSVLWCLQIVGEAAVHTGEECRSAHPHVPWQAIIAMRNRLVHAYWDINLDIVWKTVREDLPPLISSLRAILDEL